MAEDLKARLAAAKAVIAAHEEKREGELELRQVVLAEVRARFITELGPEGEAFALLDAGAEGPIVLGLGATVLFKRFRSKVDDPKGKGITLEACQEFVTPCVAYPDKPAFLAICDRRAGLIYDLANELHALYGRNEATERSK